MNIIQFNSVTDIVIRDEVTKYKRSLFFWSTVSLLLLYTYEMKIIMICYQINQWWIYLSTIIDSDYPNNINNSSF